MNAMDIKPSGQRRGCCSVSHHSLCLESFVITFIFISALAITGDMLTSFGYITVTLPHNTSSDGSLLKENDEVMDILYIVLPYTSLSIAGLFAIEVLFKAFCLRTKWLKQPWQIVDCLIVGLTLGAELANYFLVLPYATLRAVCYIVLLRLWRLPSVCRIRSQDVRSALEDEIEILRCGTKRTEETSTWHEGNMTHQKDMLRSSKSEKESLKNISFGDNGNIVTDDGRCILRGCSPVTPQLFSFPENANGCQQIKNSRRWKKDNTDLNSHVEMSQYKTRAITSQSRERSETTISTSFIEFTSTKNSRESAEHSIRQQTKNVSVFEKTSNEITDEVFVRRSSIPQTDGSYTFSPSSSPSPFSLIKTRNRRSSTSEFIDYNSLCSQDKDTSMNEQVKKSASCPSLDSENCENETMTESRHSGHVKPEEVHIDDIDRKVEMPESSSSETSSGMSAVVRRDKKIRRNRKDYKRFTSCPEYVYTQRMSITPDESILIEEGHTIEDPSLYDNMGFLSDEDISSVIMAEFDGSKTYRNEEGVPITSL